MLDQQSTAKLVFQAKASRLIENIENAEITHKKR